MPENQTAEICRMARLQALLYYLFAKTLTERYGDEGREVVRQVIWEFGRIRGERVRAGVETLGLDATADNYGKVPDLPSTGWERETLESNSQRHHTRITYCPFAEEWESLGPEAVELGRIFCEVDPAKYRAFNPSLGFERLESVLEGGECCDMLVSARPDE